MTILLVEDDPGHATLIRMNLESAGVKDSIIFIDNGQDAVDFVFGEGAYAGQTLPRQLLILLDLNLPVLNGFQVLERLKSDARSKTIPIIVLTTTQENQEIARCYELGCNMYLSKPIEYSEFTFAIRQLGLFLSVLKMPE